MFLDTPLPPEEPAGENPPDGAILDYYLRARAREVTLEILEGEGPIRKFSSRDEREAIDPSGWRHPAYWLRPPERLSVEAGHHRFVWDLRYPPPPGTARELSIAAVHGRTPTGPQGPFVAPGTYRVRLTVDGSAQERTLEVRLDPRVEMSAEDLRLQTSSSMDCYRGYLALHKIREAIDAGSGEWKSFRGEGEPGEPDTLYGGIRETPPEQETVVGLQSKLLHLMKLLQEADARPTSQALEAVEKLKGRVQDLEERWRKLRR
jgi:hypothetical protein